MIIGVFGISGVGKSTLVNEFLSTHKNVDGFSASHLIRLYGGVIDHQKITISLAEANQIILLNAINRYREKNTKPLIIEMHNIIETNDGILNIDSIFSSLIIDAACFIFKEPSIISEQRDSDSEKKRNPASIASIELLQEKSLHLFRGRFSQINNLVIDNEHQKSFNKFMELALN